MDSGGSPAGSAPTVLMPVVARPCQTIEQLGDEAADDHRRDHVGNLLDVALGQDAGGEGDQADGEHPGIDVEKLHNS